MSSQQKKIEAIIVALLKTQSPFTSASTAPVLHYDADGDTVSSKSRVVVRASEPVPLVPSFSPTAAESIAQSDVEIAIRLPVSASATMDTWEAAVDAALATSPTAVQTLAASYFANGFALDNVTAGSRHAEGAENRERVKTVRAVFVPV